MKNSLAHIEINVSNINVSKDFYSLVLKQLGWISLESDDSSAGFKAKDKTHLYLVQIEDEFRGNLFFRKNIGLNHIAFRVDSKEEVTEFSDFLDSEGIKMLYHARPKDYSKEYRTEEYFAVFFEDPDKIKLEVVFVK